MLLVEFDAVLSESVDVVPLLLNFCQIFTDAVASLG